MRWTIRVDDRQTGEVVVDHGVSPVDAWARIRGRWDASLGRCVAACGDVGPVVDGAYLCASCRAILTAAHRRPCCRCGTTNFAYHRHCHACGASDWAGD